MLKGYRDVPDLDRDISDHLLFSLMNHALMLICKFLEVWDDLGSLAPHDVRVISARRAVQPFVDRIEMWPGLEAFRNTTLAHAYEDKTGAPVPPWDMLYDHNAPTYYAEVILLQHCVHGAVAGILACFELEYLAIKPLVGPSDRPVPTAGPGIEKGKDIPTALGPIGAEADRRLAALGVSLKGTIAREFRDALRRR